MTPGPAIAQTLGPMGINIGDIISKVNSQTSKFKGINVPVHLTIDQKTKKVEIKVLSPPTSELIKKELGIEKASAARLKQKVGNLAIEQVISISKSKHDNLLSNTFLGTLKSVIGTCQALGVLIENKEPKEIMNELSEGKYGDEIDSKKTEISPEKKKELSDYFKQIEEKQEAIAKAEEAEKAAEEEKKVAEKTEKLVESEKKESIKAEKK